MASPTTETLAAPPSHHRLLYLLAAVAQGLGPLLAQPFVQRRLGEDQWGRVSFSTSLISVGLIVMLVGLPLIITRVHFEPPEGHKKSRSLAAYGIGQSVALALVSAVGLAIVMFFTGTLSDDLAFVIALIVVGLHGCTQMCLAVLRAEHRAIAFVTVTIIAQTVGHLAGLAMIILVAPTATVYMLSFAAVASMATLLSAWFTRPRHPFAFPKIIKTAMRTTLPILPHSVALILMLQGESFIITAYQGPAVYGFYGAMLPMALGPLAVIMALSNVWETTILAHRGNDSNGQVFKIQREAALIGVALVLAGSAAAVFAAHILFKDPSTEQLQLARVLPLMSAGYVIFLIATTQLVAIGRTKLMAAVTPAVAIVYLLLILAPAREGNLILVGIVKVASFALLGLVHMWVARRYDKSLVSARTMIGCLAASAVITVLVMLLPTDYVTGLITFGAAGVLLVVGALMVFLRIRSKSPSSSESPKVPFHEPSGK